MSNATQKTDLRAWLGDPANRNLLARVARAVYRELKLRHIPFGFLDQERQLNEPPENILDAIQSELTLFILEKQSVMEGMLAAGERPPVRYLRESFIRRCLDTARRSGTDRFRHFYKRAADVLRDSKGVHTMAARGRSTAFSLDPTSHRIPPLTQEDLEDIAFPAELAGSRSFESVNKKAVITDLAVYFWRELSRRWKDRPIWVELKDFVRWIDRQVPLKVSFEPKGSIRFDLLQQLSNGASLPQASVFDPEKVKKWAFQFAARLSDKEKTIFYLSCFQNLNLREIAEQLNYAGSSGPKYILDASIHELRKFLRDLPWLSPDDLNEDAVELFMDTLRLILKNSDS
jgi:hypothetical protein